MIYYNHKGQKVGEMIKGIYVKRVDPEKHFMKIYQGYGISKEIFEKLIEDGCTEIRINTGKDLYKISLEDFQRRMIEANFEGPQVFCPIKHFVSYNETHGKEDSFKGTASEHELDIQNPLQRNDTLPLFSTEG